MATSRRRLHAAPPAPAPGTPARSEAADREALESAQRVLRAEVAAIEAVGSKLNGAFPRAVEMVLACSGRVVVTGMGKPGFIAQKISATFASTGTPSLYLHPAEALHGDLGRLVAGDLVLALSNSGQTDELVRLLPPLKRLSIPIIALTGDGQSALARAAEVVLDIGPVSEACPLGLAPTASTIALLALGDALAMSVLDRRQFSPEKFAELHPGGKLGQKFTRVRDVMRTGAANPLVSESAPLREAVGVMTRTTGRPGATSVVDSGGRLVGIFTDGDLRRLVEDGRQSFEDPVSSAMGRHPRTVSPDDLATHAADLLRDQKIDQVPVVDGDGRPVGLLDVQDLLAARLLG